MRKKNLKITSFEAPFLKTYYFFLSFWTPPLIAGGVIFNETNYVINTSLFTYLLCREFLSNRALLITLQPVVSRTTRHPERNSFRGKKVY